MQHFSQEISINSEGRGEFVFSGLTGKLWGHQIGRGGNRQGDLVAMTVKTAQVFAIKKTWPFSLAGAVPVLMPCVDPSGNLLPGQYTQIPLINDDLGVVINGGTPNTKITFEFWIV